MPPMRKKDPPTRCLTDISVKIGDIVSFLVLENVLQIKRLHKIHNMLKRVTVTLSFVFYLCGGGGGFGITTRWPSSLFPSFEMASGREATHSQELITEKSTPSSLSPTNRSFMDFLRASLSVAPFERSVPFFPRKEGKGILHWEEKERRQGGGGVVFSLADQCHLAACEPKWITG